ncbi:hypothetical protein GXP67_20780 [Rhodocytophaga rosea]|uniref:Uncharacterized protein n=1 Tax=Rhodocytophaga rosea TaxID=2704465 RepID=A0A6C0GLF4_9BACT|nr:hypothetical protein [Rhodocytophaga rosea]QHT68911.1 hypothetical protein GXP67_20780 [Rhodocytophaga rosea]
MKIDKYLLLLLSLAILPACQNKPEKPDLRGHWHVYRLPFDSTFSTWDIIDSTKFIVNVNNYEDAYERFYHLSVEDTVFQNVQFNHFEGNFKYQLSFDTLFLKEIDYIPVNDSTYLEYAGEIFAYGIRVDASTCDLTKEYYGHLQININLPISEKVTEQDDLLTVLSLVSYMDIGKPKSFIKQYSSDTFLIQVNDVFIPYHSVPEYIDQERAKLPEVDRDSLMILMGIDRNTPAIMVDSVEQSIHASYPMVDIYYACLPEGKTNMHKPIFTSLKNEFSKSANKPAASLTISIGEDKQVEWTIEKRNQKPESQRYDLQTAEGKDKLREAILQANQNKQPLGIQFTFAGNTTFQDYITAQTTIKQMLEETAQ